MSLATTRTTTGSVSKGFRHFVEAFLDCIPHNLFFCRRFLLMVADRCDMPTRNFTGYGVRLITPDELPTFSGYHFSRERAEQELRAGSACVLVHSNGSAVSWRWGGTGKLYVRHCNTVVDTGENGFYSYRLETIESERFKGHVNTCMRTMYEHYKAMGRPKNYTLVSKTDSAVVKWHDRGGFTTVGEILALSIFGVHVCYYFTWPFHNKRVTVTLRVPPAGTREL